jgi:hypothetical protein
VALVRYHFNKVTLPLHMRMTLSDAPLCL